MSKHIFKITPPVKKAIKRIKRMEKHFNHISKAAQTGKLREKSIRKSLKMLERYYSSGKWTRDYILDENHLVPQTMKRGVLSEDGVYNLLCDISQTK